MAAIGNCGVRAYLSGNIIKKKGDPKIYVQPKRVAVRIWDDYNFRDEGVFDLGAYCKAASQFLGIWANRADGSFIELNNADFIGFREKFMGRYNQFLDLLTATDRVWFATISHLFQNTSKTRLGLQRRIRLPVFNLKRYHRSFFSFEPRTPKAYRHFLLYSPLAYHTLSSGEKHFQVDAVATALRSATTPPHRVRLSRCTRRTLTDVYLAQLKGIRLKRSLY